MVEKSLCRVGGREERRVSEQTRKSGDRREADPDEEE